MRAVFLGCVILGLGLVAVVAAESPVVTDQAGKDVTLKKYKIVGGLRKMNWVEGKPEAFEIREFNSTTFKDGILTWVPLSRIESIQYDYRKDVATMSVKVAGIEKPLAGSTRFKDINAITIEAEIDQGAAGVVDLRFRGGLMDGGIKGVKFPNAKPMEKAPEGAVFSLVVPPEGKGTAGPTVQTVRNIQALYRAGAEETPLSYLMFKKTLKVELSNIQKMTVSGYNAKDRTAECELKMKDGTDLSVTLLSVITVDGKTLSLMGLLGDVPAGQRLFPVHTFTEFQPGEIKLDEKKEPEPKTPPKKIEPKKTPPKKTNPKE